VEWGPDRGRLDVAGCPAVAPHTGRPPRARTRARPRRLPSMASRLISGR